MCKIELIKSIRGKNNLFFKNFSYDFNKKVGEISKWRCQNRNCKGSLSTTSDWNVIEEIPHTAHTNEKKIIRLKTYPEIKKKF